MDDEKKIEINKLIAEFRRMSDSQISDAQIIVKELIEMIEASRKKVVFDMKLIESLQNAENVLIEVEKEMKWRKDATYEQRRDRFFETLKEDIPNIDLDTLKERREMIIMYKALKDILDEKLEKDIKIEKGIKDVIELVDKEIVNKEKAKEPFKPTDSELSNFLNKCSKEFGKKD